MSVRRRVRALALTLAGASLSACGAPPDWVEPLARDLARIDEASPGRLGVYLKHLGDGGELRHAAERPWYLGSTVKVPIAVALLQTVEAGERTLKDEVELREEDKVDGSGGLVWQAPGARFTLAELLHEMLVESDNTAANLLVRVIGEDALNRRTRDNAGRGFARLTDFTQVRRDLYGQLHPDAAQLDNQALVEVAAARLGRPRYEAVARALSRDPGELHVPSLEEAYARYYDSGVNSATLEAYGRLLERLVRGELLAERALEPLYAGMKLGRYEAYRLEAGLPREVPFLHKTGTQWERACHVGVIAPQAPGQSDTVVVVACAEGLDEAAEAGALFERVGEAIARHLLAGRAGGG